MSVRALVSRGRDTPLAVVLTGSDVEQSPLTFSVFSNPSHGSLSGTPPNLTYTPALGYTGPDSFTFRAWDQTGATAGQQGTKVNVTALGTGGTAPFSAATDIATLVVSDQNDAPVLNNTGAPTLDPITEDQTASAGNTVQSIIDELGGTGITDADTGALEGIAIVATANSAGGRR